MRPWVGSSCTARLPDCGPPFRKEGIVRKITVFGFGARGDRCDSLPLVGPLWGGVGVAEPSRHPRIFADLFVSSGTGTVLIAKLARAASGSDGTFRHPPHPRPSPQGRGNRDG